jgi:hypothetical protein
MYRCRTDVLQDTTCDFVAHDGVIHTWNSGLLAWAWFAQMLWPRASNLA